MNGPEARLRDALRHVGEIVQPGDVPPPPPFPARRTRAFARPMLVVAATVVAVGGAAVAGNAILDRPGGEKFVGAAVEPREHRISVFLCAKTSSERTCEGKEVTEQQRQDIDRRVRALPGVRGVEYESQAEGYRRFTEEGDWKDFPDEVRAGDIPACFRVRLSYRVDVKSIKAVLEAVPGVDTVIVES
ncbi:hypothetical protein BZB76_5186 [Actinomadura pelletieri DSM 43383]|uniref:FtsX extracellular domain-containing protein n=1 Tax=Actinomadura pelletieri DSM 43383 TaxID=1120940 RepID=A0A495QFS6_9ACTN|nr:permease-like cell division protein FtsX [Actinomadura pelletieri]RKS70709.1 hypothetical protein BZB76_5186 [Actinomadura pelletieri DSM 43383]